MLKVRYTPDSWLGKLLLGSNSKDTEYIGSGTVWYELPDWQRCDVMMDTVLSNFMARVDHETS